MGAGDFAKYLMKPPDQYSTTEFIFTLCIQSSIYPQIPLPTLLEHLTFPCPSFSLFQDPMARRSSAVVAALVHTISVASQNIAVNCGSQARNTIVPDNVFQEVKVRDNLLPSMRDTICNFGQDGACTALGGRCIIESIFYNENDKISVTLNKTLTIGPNGGNAQLGPCSRVMVGTRFLSDL